MPKEIYGEPKLSDAVNSPKRINSKETVLSSSFMNNNEELLNKDVKNAAELTNDDLTNAVGGENKALFCVYCGYCLGDVVPIDGTFYCHGCGRYLKPSEMYVDDLSNYHP